jgi:hypothetical protein
MSDRSRCAALLLVVVCACGQPASRFKEPPAGSFAVETQQVKIGDGAAAPLQGASVTKDFFAGTNVQPLLGRFFIGGDFASAGPSTVVLGNALWEERLGRSPTIIGQAIEIDGRQAIVVGIAPKGFDVPAGTQFWLPKK